jgi:hypothetical protein
MLLISNSPLDARNTTIKPVWRFRLWSCSTAKCKVVANKIADYGPVIITTRKPRP